MKRFKVFFIAFVLCWVALAFTYLFLDYSCSNNAGCSGEWGIVFFFLGAPWGLFWMAQTDGFSNFLNIMVISIFLNTLILSGVVQLLFLAVKFVRRER